MLRAIVSYRVGILAAMRALYHDVATAFQSLSDQPYA